ncbi:Do family serine endopeptidase [Hyphomicrobium sp.]|jgi:Do/DeqQ family serine protease|uniref:Do family serine endopeptidase n=1 Tax=Hyphomicrobium sp. TaxID=82 RepID=UPI002BBC7CBB|nr:Do family serine endopeptidase [Hyphomicrobium sp.]HVZ05072.1 Do family serine endopeptidase [Hyphomicrobium sp.]
MTKKNWLLIFVTAAATSVLTPLILRSVTPTYAQEKVAPPSRQAIQYSYAPIVRKVAPAVVNVYVRTHVQTMASPFGNDPWFRRFFGDAFGQPSERVMSSLGSGVIVNPEGLIVTNNHVVKGRGETEIRVALSDRREYDAKVISKDEKADIAVLKIEGGDGKFPYLQFDDSDRLEVGDLVLAIGNPFGVGQTVTSGIVSALSRSEMAESDSQVFIQTDAAINPGNSGGALVDMSGRLVGINTMIYSQSGGSVGIGFAIPSNLVRVYAESAAHGRKVERPWIGAKLEAMSHDFAEGLGLNRISGAVVTRLYNKGPAVDAGLREGDVITHVDGVEVADARAVYYRLATKGIGQTAHLTVIRKNQPVDISLPLIAAPKPGKNDVRNLSGNNPLAGARISNIFPSVADELGIDEMKGVVITSVRDGSVAQSLGFQPGDIIVSISGQKIENVVQAERAVGQRQRTWQVAVKRGNRVLQLQVPG